MLGLVLAVVLGVVLLLTRVLAARAGIAEPVLQLAAGLLIGFAPALRGVEMPSEVVLLLFLPALLYWESLNIGLRDVRANVRVSALLATGLVALTAAAVAVVVHAFGVPWGPSWVLGGALAPTDATAVAVLARTLPARVVTTLRTESLVNDGTALVIYGVAVAATVTEEPVDAREIAGLLTLSLVGGVAAGVVVAWLSNEVRRRVHDPLTQNLNSLVTPFAAYLLAEEIHASGVIAVVVCGLIALRRVPRFSFAAARQQRDAFWGLATYVLNGALFVLVGIEAQAAARELTSVDLVHGVQMVLLVTVTVFAARVLWLLTTPYVIRALDRRPVQRARRVSTKGRLVYAAAGFRGAVSMAAALGVPFVLDSGAPFPDRDLIVFVAAGVIILSLGPAFILPGLVRWSGLHDDGRADIERAEARRLMVGETMGRLDDLAATLGTPPAEVSMLRSVYRQRLRAHAGGTGPRAELDDAELDDAELDDAERPDPSVDGAYAALALAAIGSERAVLLRLRDEQRIDDEVLAELQRRLDLEEILLHEELPG